jgi:hypothetical protein
MSRMTKTSIANLKVADSARIERFQGGPSCLVSVWKNGNRAYLCGADQNKIMYSSPMVARRSIRRIRPDLEPTEI